MKIVVSKTYDSYGLVCWENDKDQIQGMTVASTTECTAYLKVSATTGGVKAVKEIPDNSGSTKADKDFLIVLYKLSSGTYKAVDKGLTNSSGEAYFNNLAAGTYKAAEYVVKDSSEAKS